VNVVQRVGGLVVLTSSSGCLSPDFGLLSPRSLPPCEANRGERIFKKKARNGDSDSASGSGACARSSNIRTNARAHPSPPPDTAASHHCARSLIFTPHFIVVEHPTHDQPSRRKHFHFNPSSE